RVKLCLYVALVIAPTGLAFCAKAVSMRRQGENDLLFQLRRQQHLLAAMTEQDLAEPTNENDMGELCPTRRDE
uniref:hypothetical protein n=1 Tax=Marivita sp. TaxID=2003365 RepID=UPI003F6D5FC7